MSTIQRRMTNVNRKSFRKDDPRLHMWIGILTNGIIKPVASIAGGMAG